MTPLIIRTHLQLGTWGQRGSRGGMKPEPTAAETECQHQVRKSPFLLRGSLPKCMSSDHANCRKPTQVLISVLRAQAECGSSNSCPSSGRHAEHSTRLRTRERLDERNANDLKVSVIDRSCTFILGMLDKHTNHRTNVLHRRREPFLQTQLT